LAASVAFALLARRPPAPEPAAPAPAAVVAPGVPATPTVEAIASTAPAPTPPPAAPPAPAEPQTTAPPPDPLAERNARIATLLSDARADLDAQRLTTPAGQNAYEKYRAVLRLEANNAEATQGIVALSDRYLALGDRELGRGDLKRAEAHLAKAESLTPKRPAIATARELLAMRRQELAKKQASRPVTSTPAPAVAGQSRQEEEQAPGFFESLGRFFNGEPRPAPAPVEDRSEQFRQKLGGQ
ncbi:MAG: hypothetical protein HY749_03145, partial [Gammaproteobacteria bacterium]|nr:hypothetical protein [Gammaproteobacteria bacterium]